MMEMKKIVLVSLLPSSVEINQPLQSSLRGVCVFAVSAEVPQKYPALDETRCT